MIKIASQFPLKYSNLHNRFQALITVGIRAWNLLSDDLKTVVEIGAFKRKLRTDFYETLSIHRERRIQVCSILQVRKLQINRDTTTKGFRRRKFFEFCFFFYCDDVKTSFSDSDKWQ